MKFAADSKSAVNRLLTPEVVLVDTNRISGGKLGMVLLVGFSLGLAAVLTAIGLAVIYAKHLLPDQSTSRHPAFRLIPVFSAGVVLCIGLVMTGISLGVLNPGRIVG